MTRKLLLLLTVIFLSGCAALQKGGFLTPPPTQSEYFHTSGAGFTLTAGDPDSFRYIISLDVVKWREKAVFIEANFENPSSPESPIVVTQTIQPEESRLTLESPPVYGLRSYEGYVIDIYIYEDATKVVSLGKHRQVVQSIIDQKEMNKVFRQPPPLRE